MGTEEIKRFDINSLLSDEGEFEKTKAGLKNQILSDFKDRHLKCVFKVDDGEVELTYGQALINLFLLSFYVGRNVKICEEDIFEKGAMNQKCLEDYFNRVLERVKEDNSDFEYYRRKAYDVLNEMSDFSSKSNILVGTTIDYLDFVELEKNDPEAQKLFTGDIPYGLQYSDIEAMFKKRGNDLMSYFDSHPETNLSPFTRSETGINVKQLTQCLGFVGLKPDIDGTVIPCAIKDNFLHGLTNLESYYINAKGTRLALCTNFKMTRKSGYLTRKLSLLMIDRWHDDGVEDCGTKHFVQYKIENAKKLSMIDGRNYYDLVDGKADYDHLKTINGKTDIQLIGKTIALRSPVTCAGGKHCCRTCYGKALSSINKDLNTGLVAVLLMTNVLTQRLLSAKHLLSTNTDKTDWGDAFDDAFTVNMDSIYFTDDIQSEISFAYPSEESYDEDMDAYEVSEFDIKDVDRKVTHYKAPVPLYINPEFIPSKKPDDDEPVKVTSAMAGTGKFVFKFTPHNNMLSKSLQNILDIVESKDHLGITNYDDLVNKFADLLIENGMGSINSVHAEMICSALIVDEKTGKGVDWNKETIDPYVINRVSKSVLDSPISVSLAFERLSDQLSDLSTYCKDDSSIMDCFFE